MTQTTFQRVEKKYKLNAMQYNALYAALQDKMQPDEYGEYSIVNIYYDTEDFALIRHSLEKPIYKEKLRMRSYGAAQRDSTVFLELKKKYDGIVYKRREVLPHMQAKRFMGDLTQEKADSQILQEIHYVASQHAVVPKAYIAYDRKALMGIENNEFRMTFDTNLLFRSENLRLDSPVYGTPLLKADEVVMEIKVPDAFPLWMSRLLSELAIFPNSFSKYGVAYKNHILTQETHHQGGKRSA